MSLENGVIIGLEIEKNMGQISYCHSQMDEPLTCEYEGEKESLRLPVTAYKYKGENRFLFGDAGYRESLVGTCLRVDNYMEALFEGRSVQIEELEYDPKQILEAYISYMIGHVNRVCELPIEAVAVCTGQYRKDFLDILRQILEKLYPQITLFFMSKEDCFAYYALSMKEELYRNCVGMFEYEDNKLTFLRLERNSDRFGRQIYLTGAETVIEKTDEDADKKMTDFAAECMKRDIYSSIYLTGGGFLHAEYEQFVTFVCTRRRVFLGQNLYSKGACYGAYDLLKGKFFATQLLVGGSHILWNVDIEFMERGVPKAYRVVHGGNFWYQEESQTDFILWGKASLKLYFTPVLKGNAKTALIELKDFPKRPEGTTRIGVTICFKDENTMVISVRDKGFGKLFAPSDTCVTRVVSMKEDVAWMA